MKKIPPNFRTLILVYEITELNMIMTTVKSKSSLKKSRDIHENMNTNTIQPYNKNKALIMKLSN